jgi:hypothetical protein
MQSDHANMDDEYSDYNLCLTLARQGILLLESLYQIFFVFVIFKIVPCEIFSRTGFEL